MPPTMLPRSIREALVLLERSGHETALVGRCVRELLSDQAPADFEAVTRADAATLLERFPHAVVTGAEAQRLTLPTPDGPLDLLPLSGEPLDSHLQHRDFSMHAIALRASDAETDAVIDPHAGRADLEARRLRTPGSAKERLAEDPIRALRAARLVAEHALEVDPELESALPEAAAGLAGTHARRRRVELERLLCAPHAARGLALLRRTGLERAIAPGTGDDVVDMLDHLPRDLELRLAAWLRGTRARAILRDLRCPRDRAVRVERILQLHPIDSGTASARESRARKLVRQPEREADHLLALREAETRARGESLPNSLQHVRRCIDRARRSERSAEQRAELVLDGRAVMDHLSCEPGAQVGRALRFLAEQVAEDPSRNTEQALRSLLDAWAGRGD